MHIFLKIDSVQNVNMYSLFRLGVLKGSHQSKKYMDFILFAKLNQPLLSKPILFIKKEEERFTMENVRLYN